MKVRVLKALYYGGELKKPGTELEMPDQAAAEAAWIGRVERIAAPKATGPMTTDTSPALANKPVANTPATKKPSGKGD